MKYRSLLIVILFLFSCTDNLATEKPLKQSPLPEYSKELPPINVELSSSNLISIRRLKEKPKDWISTSPYHYFGQSSDLYDKLIHLNEMAYIDINPDKPDLTPFFKPFVQSPGGFYSINFSWNLHGKNRQMRDLFYNEVGTIFHLIVKEEMISTKCYILYKHTDNITKLQPAKGNGPRGYSSGAIPRCQNCSMDRLANILENVLGFPVVDETELKGSYDFNLDINVKAYIQLIKRLNKYGLSLKIDERRINCVTVRPK